jgi:hypothetical protein
MTASNPAYFEFIDFISEGNTPEQIIAFRPSTAARRRVEELIAKEKGGRLPKVEQSELDYFFQLEHILRVAKAHAEKVLARTPRSERGRSRRRAASNHSSRRLV